MKRILSALIICVLACCVCVKANEVEDDYLDIAANYCVVGDYNSAMEYLDKILKINPDNKQAQNLKRGLSHVISGDKSTFIANVSPLTKQAMEYQRAGNDKEELNTLLKATQSQNAYIAYYYLGNYYRARKDYKNALDAYNASSSARSDFAPAYLTSAIVLYEMGQYQAVLNPIDKYLTFNPNDDLAYAVKSRAEFALGMLSESKSDNTVALDINNCPEYNFDKAKILYKEGKFQESRDLFKSLLNDIQTSKIYEYMGLCDMALNDYKNALVDFDRAILLSDDDEYLEMKYNEVKSILESNQNGHTPQSGI